jgi:PPE-repeat protein
LLRHFSIESNEVLNMYRGVATLDGTGSVTVALPDYFDAINTNYSYQLTSIGSAQQPYIAEEIQENSFTIAGAPNAKVSWTVYAERNDAYMQLHPESREAIVNKTGTRQGKYVTPSFYGHDGRALFTKSQEGTPSTITDPYAMNAQVLKRNEVPQPKINSDEELISTQSDKVSDKSENK